VDQRLNQLFKDIVNLCDHIKRETEESQRYAQNNDRESAKRNMNASRDELDDLVRKFRDSQNILEG
jgi:hypothetical protein